MLVEMGMALVIMMACECAGAASFPGAKTEWMGYDRYDFTCDGRECLVVCPKETAPGTPWIWRARFFGHEPQTDLALLDRGFHLVYIDVSNLFGNPQAVGHWDAFYDYLTGEHGFAKKPALEGMSRGGLIVFNWAAANPEKVACIYADAPVCDIKSWPGGKGAGTGNAECWGPCLKAYGLTEEEAMVFDRNPIDNLAPLAKAGAPLLHVCGGADTGVPVAENTAIVEERYKALGGDITVIIKEGVGHHPHSLEDPALIVDFILTHTGQAGDASDRERSLRTSDVTDQETLDLVFCCAADNDLFRVMSAGGTNYPRYDSATKAVEQAAPGAGVLVLADGYPATATAVDEAVFEQAETKGLRLYIEYPASLPGAEVGAPRRVDLERAVVASDVFGEALPQGQLLAIHDCHFVEMEDPDPYLVLAKVAGFDTAVYGLEDVAVHPLLFECAGQRILVSTTKLSQFVTARYAPKDAMQAVWRVVLSWLQPGGKVSGLDWTPAVRPTYARDEDLPADATRNAIIRGIDWHTNARMLMHESWRDEYDRRREAGEVNPANPVDTMPDSELESGDGEFGVLEGFSSRIRYDGTQPVRWWLRTDSNGESSLAFALRSRIDGDERSSRIAGNLLDWVYFNSGLFQNDPEKANFGLVHWSFDSSSLYGDNDAKIILGCIGTGAILEDDRWDEALVRNVLGNFRTTGTHGFRGAALRDEELLEKGWRHYWDAPTTHFAPHYQAWIWASYLWLYDKTGYEPLLERTRGAIRMMMDTYPDGWRWTNGIQQERGRMLLALAWLIRVDDRPEHRAWLKQMADDMQTCQDESGGIREELGPVGHGSYRPPESNAEYGTNEASLIQANGDPVADLLYTCNFTFLGLHEAYAATGESQYREMADRLAEFLVRIQVRSDAHPELDGGWFRAFDYEQWDYFGSNADSGWGAWSIEVGWTQAWIPTVLAMRELDVNLWDLSEDSKVGEHWEKTRQLMLPE